MTRLVIAGYALLDLKNRWCLENQTNDASSRGKHYKRKAGHGGKQEPRNNMHQQQEEKKLKLLETHLKAMEEIEETMKEAFKKKN